MNNGLASFRLLNKVKWALFIFITIWGSNLPGPVVFGFSLYPLRILVIIYPLVLMLKKRRIGLTLNRKNIPIAIILLCSIVTMVWTVNRQVALTNLIVLITNVIVFFITIKMLKTTNDYVDAGFGLRLNMYIIAGLALMESITGQYMYNTAYVWMTREVNMFGTIMPKVFFYNVNGLASFFGFCIPVALHSLQKVRSSGVQKLLITFTSLVVVLLTGSRGGLLAVIMTIVTMVFIGNDAEIQRSKRGKRIFVALIVVILIIYYAPQLLYVLTDAGTHTTLDSDNRLTIWYNVFRISAQRFFIGTGIGTCEIIYGAAHNVFLQVLVELGLIGLLAYLYFIYYLIFDNFRISKHKGLLLSFFISLIICGITQSLLFLTYYVWLVFGFIAALKEID